MSHPWEWPPSYSRSAVDVERVALEAHRLREPVPEYGSQRWDEIGSPLIARRARRTNLAPFFAQCVDHRPSRRERLSRTLHALGRALAGEFMDGRWAA